MSGMGAPRILVTGGTGFLGSALVRHLVGEGHEVAVLTRRPVDAPPASLAAVAPKLTWLPGDLLTSGSYEAAVRAFAPTLAFHLAWHVAPRDYLTSRLNLAHLAASARLAEALLAAGCRRLVGVGTCYEYAPSAEPLQAGTSPLGPGSLYAACKHAAATVTRALYEAEGAAFVWARLYLQYGPHEYPSRLVPWLARALAAGEAVTLRSHGRQVRDYLHVADVAAALTRIGEAFDGPEVDVCSGEATSVRALATDLAARIGCGSVAFAPDDTPLGEPFTVLGDPRRLRALGWWPRRGLAEYVADREFELVREPPTDPPVPR